MKTKTQTTETICNHVMELQRQRVGIIKMINAQNSQAVAFVSRLVEYDSFDDEKERQKKWNLCKKIHKAIVKDEPAPEGQEQAYNLAKPVVISAQLSMDGLTAERKKIEKAMTDCVKQLDICDWWISEKGRSFQGLAVIIGEAGNLDNYANPAKLWKRFGVAVLDGIRQGGLSKGAKADDWIEHGYCPRRRAALWTIGDCLIKTNGADGTYRQTYNNRKEIEKTKVDKDGKDIRPIVAHRRAQRYMEKRLLRDLWNEWHGETAA